jgi:arsenate reductase
MKKVLFICVYNSARSQMAEGLAGELGKGKIEAYSAGHSATTVNPYAIRVMREIGVDISGQRSKSLEVFKNQEFDFVITLCSEAEESCPVMPGKANKLHWPFPDPARVRGGEEEILDSFRRVRDELKVRIQDFLDIF